MPDRKLKPSMYLWTPHSSHLYRLQAHKTCQMGGSQIMQKIEFWLTELRRTSKQVMRLLKLAKSECFTFSITWERQEFAYCCNLFVSQILHFFVLDRKRRLEICHSKVSSSSTWLLLNQENSGTQRGQSKRLSVREESDNCHCLQCNLNWKVTTACCAVDTPRQILGFLPVTITDFL